MLPKTLAQVTTLVAGDLIGGHPDQPIRHVETDTRLPFREDAVFVALDGAHYRGHRFLAEAIARGAKAAIVGDRATEPPAGLPLIRVASPLRALQALAGAHRTRLGLDTLAITGSNGKTILKDFLRSLLHEHLAVNSSPGSYNSQVGVALSLLRLGREDRLALIEAGISQRDEMPFLEKMIQPRFGILTNIGLAHFEGFGSRKGIAEEKLRLFENIPRDGWLLLPAEPLPAPLLGQALADNVFVLHKDRRLPRLVETKPLAGGRSSLTVGFPDGRLCQLSLAIDYSWREVFDTLLLGFGAAFLLGVAPERIAAAAADFSPPLNRIEIWTSPQGSTLVNDAYSADPVSTKACLNIFESYPAHRKIFVFGGMKELGPRCEYEHRIIGETLCRQRVDVLVTVGSLAQKVTEVFKQGHPEGRVFSFADTEQCIDFAETFSGGRDLIVVKGPRELRLDQIAVRFKARLTQTLYYINLCKMRHNLLSFREIIPRESKIMVMLKAFAYGADALHIAHYLQGHVNHFGVAYTKEAVALRRAGVSAEIMVQLVLEADVADVVKLGLQAVVFRLELAERLAARAREQGKTVKVHIKVDTGMGRFGLFPAQVRPFVRRLKALEGLQIEGLMTHFSAAEDPASDTFTRLQIRRFQDAIRILAEEGIQPPLIHAAATSAAARFPESHFSMIRIGLGMFGICPSPQVAEAIQLVCPIALVSKIGDIRLCPAGTTVSYGAGFTTRRESRLAVIPMGYYDGLSRGLANKGRVKLRGRDAPIVGAVCMDFTVIDITDIPQAVLGDPVLIFGQWQDQHLPVERLAAQEGTIPYEVLCRLSQRIQRIYLLGEDG